MQLAICHLVGRRSPWGLDSFQGIIARRVETSWEAAAAAATPLRCGAERAFAAAAAAAAPSSAPLAGAAAGERSPLLRLAAAAVLRAGLGSSSSSGSSSRWYNSSSSSSSSSGSGSSGGSGAGAKQQQQQQTKGAQPPKQQQPPPLGFARGGFKVEDFPPERIRNFCIVVRRADDEAVVVAGRWSVAMVGTMIACREAGRAGGREPPRPRNIASNNINNNINNHANQSQHNITTTNKGARRPRQVDAVGPPAGGDRRGRPRRARAVPRQIAGRARARHHRQGAGGGARVPVRCVWLRRRRCREKRAIAAWMQRSAPPEKNAHA